MLRLAGEQAAGTILWMADERAIADHIAPRITTAATEAGRPDPRIVAGVPIVVCRNDEADDARAWASRLLSHAEYSPNYQRLMEQGESQDVGDMCAAGDEDAVAARLGQYRDAGVTDLASRVVAFGRDRDSRIASRDRTKAFLASLGPEF
jgi:alkanesulfonate monooxygenase SsuD/methylene tetrahydromethanopterin reductase-like flavin-dependent oxidoreductase (luciferase family)